MSDDADRRRLHRAALNVGVLVGVASAVVVTAGVAVLVSILLLSARPEAHRGGGDAGRPGPDGDRIVVDVDHVLPWVIALGVAGVVLLALVAWFAARRAVTPLATALRLQRGFVADASHEMRTPLTALTSRVQILERRHRRGEDLTATLAALRSDAAVMDEVLTDMLLTAEGSASERTPTPVADAIAAATATIAPLAEEAGVAVVVTGASAALVRMPRVTLTRLCVALLDNAVQHSPTGATVEISAATSGDTVGVRVHDAGAGISDADRDRIFERFARGPESGRRRGFGLGLALVREAATTVGGTVGIESTSSRGTTMLLRLPAA